MNKYPNAQYRVTSPPAVCGSVVITGSLVTDSAPNGPSGDVFAFDLRTGTQRWRFHTSGGRWISGSRHKRAPLRLTGQAGKNSTKAPGV